MRECIVYLKQWQIILVTVRCQNQMSALKTDLVSFVDYYIALAK